LSFKVQIFIKVQKKKKRFARKFVALTAKALKGIPLKH
jgi:hypothetical protein